MAPLHGDVEVGGILFSGLLPLYPWFVPYNAEFKQWGVKYSFFFFFFFKVFGMIWPGIEPRSPRPLANSLTIIPLLLVLCTFDIKTPMSWFAVKPSKWIIFCFICYFRLVQSEMIFWIFHSFLGFAWGGMYTVNFNITHNLIYPNYLCIRTPPPQFFSPKVGGWILYTRTIWLSFQFV